MNEMENLKVIDPGNPKSYGNTDFIYKIMLDFLPYFAGDFSFKKEQKEFRKRIYSFIRNCHIRNYNGVCYE